MKKEKASIRIHKTYFRKVMRDERLSPRLRFGAQLFLAYIEDLFPKELLESVIESEFGMKNKNKKDDIEERLESFIDKSASTGLHQQWKEIIGGENGSRNSASHEDGNTKIRE